MAKWIVIEQAPNGECYINHCTGKSVEDVLEFFCSVDDGSVVVLNEEAWKKIKGGKLK